MKKKITVMIIVSIGALLLFAHKKDLRASALALGR